MLHMRYGRTIQLAFAALLIAISLSSSAQQWRVSYQYYTDKFNRQDYNKALEFIQEAMLAYESEFGNNDTVFAGMLSEAAHLHFILKNYNNALQLFGKSDKIILKQVGKSYQYIVNCMGIATVNRALKKYRQAESKLTEARELTEKAFGVNQVYADICRNLAELYVEMRSFDSDKEWEQCRNVYKTVFGAESAEYCDVLSDLSDYYRRRRKYTEAESSLKECLAIRQSLGSWQRINYASDAEKLSKLYVFLGRFDEAESLQLETNAIALELLGNSDDRYVEGIRNLAALYRRAGHYVKAEPHYRNVLKHNEARYGNSHANYAEACSDLGMLYLEMGNYRAAEPLLVQAKDLYQLLVGTEHINYAKSVHNLASYYIEIGNYTTATPLLEESLNIKLKTDGAKSATYANTCNNLAYLYFKTGKNSAAEKLYKTALDINEKRFGKFHLNYIKACNNLAVLYMESGNFRKAEKMLIEIKQIAKTKIGETHPYYSEICNNLAKLYHKMDKTAMAKTVFIESMNALALSFSSNMGLLTEQEKEDFFVKVVDRKMHDFNRFVMVEKAVYPELTAMVYNNSLKTKGMLLKSATALRNAIITSGDSVLVNQYDKLMKLRKQIADVYATPIYERSNKIKNLEDEANSIEKHLIASSNEFALAARESTLQWTDVQASLKQGEAAIEFVDIKAGDDSVYYVAMLITGQSQYPEMFYLFEERELKNLFGRFLMNNQRYIYSLYGSRQEPATALYNLIWAPLQDELTDCHTVFISPSGLLHKISFSALCISENRYLCDQYRILPRMSTSTIVNYDTAEITDISVFVLGGIQYNSDTTQSTVWPYLPGTLAEADTLSSLLLGGRIQHAVNKKSRASEDRFKEDVAHYNVLHISTHGFFYPDPKELMLSKMKTSVETEVETRASANGDWGFGMYAFATNRQPMMRSGLVLAGANDVWNRDASPPLNAEDGVLTALEVSQLNLLDVRLAVMSACETGLGDIRGSEGVYGLQRAFRMAGVDCIIMSLWKVADNETKEFMTIFYNKLLETRNVRQAFYDTQCQMRQKYDPYFWGAFVLLE